MGPAASVEWIAPTDADCPTRDDVEEKVRSSLRSDGHDVAARVVVRHADGAGVHVDIAWQGAHRALDAASCAEAVEATALILSLADDVDAPSRAVSPDALAPAAAPDADVAHRTSSATGPNAIFARGFVDTGALAEPALGASVGLSRRFEPLELSVDASFAAGTGGAGEGAGRSARVDSVTGGVETFLPLRPLRGAALDVGPLAGFEAGALFARGVGVDHPAAKTSGVANALAAARGRLPVSSHLVLTVDLGLAVPFDRPSFYFSPSPTDFARVAPISFRGGVGAAVRFP